MARTLLLAAAAAALLLSATPAQAEPLVHVRLPDPHLGDDDPITVGGFCVTAAVCVDTYCVDTLSPCCPIPPDVPFDIVRCRP